MEYLVLGPLEVLTDEGSPLSLPAGKQRAVLAMLLLEPNRVVPIYRLIEGLWGRRPTVSATNAVQVYASRLRQAFGRAGAGRVLTTVPPGYLMRVDERRIDAHRAEALAEAGRRLLSRDPPAAARMLRQSLAYWRGPSLGDLRGLPFAGPAAARLDELRAAALRDRIDADLAVGRHGALLGELAELSGIHPLDERVRCQLMVALYRSGRQAQALQVARAGRKMLLLELGIDPGPELRALESAILSQDRRLSDAARNSWLAPART